MSRREELERMARELREAGYEVFSPERLSDRSERPDGTYLDIENEVWRYRDGSVKCRWTR